ncbi:MAG TPA: phosphotransferase [Streptosporangiaceae bacterium]|nr:phosphotransferase [Streptosporangiaceae bacterium]
MTWPDGRQGVLTWRPGVTLAGLRAGQLAVMETLRRAGYPVPAVQLAVELGGPAPAAVLVCELLPGAPPDRVTPELLEQAIALSGRHARALAGRPGVPAMRLFLTSDGPGFCQHGPLRAYSDRTRRLDRWITSVGARHPDSLDGDDAVHADFQPGNFLAEGGRITGVVDWDGAARGDRRLDLVTLRFGLHGIDADARAVRRLDQLLDAFPAGVLAPMWAHLSLRLTDWVIRHYTAAHVEHWLDLAEQRLE